MALSFKESKRMTDESPVMTMEATMEDARPVVDYDEDITTFDTGDQNFTRSGNYTWYDTFSDNDFSTVDTNKEITLSPTQVNITQENNSQVIPFEMPRYYDGVDLMGMTIQIHYVNANNAENYAAPINVSYSDDKIRFYWMVSDYATVKDGVLKFEIMATGAITVPSSGESKNYLWRTKPNEKLNVLKSLTGTAMNDPTGDDWYTQFLSTMSQKVGEAQTAATLAAQSAKDAQAVVDGLADTLANYYTKEEVNGFITLLQGDIAKVDGLAKFDVQYDAETQTIKFLNGDKLIKTITLNTDPSAEWVTAFNKTVDAKIDENVSVVQTELTEYKTSNDAAVKNLKDSVGNLPETLQSDYYNKQATNKLLESKAEKASVETVSNDLTVVKNTASGLQNSIDTINSDISDIQEQLKNVNPDPNAGREYDITYEDSKLNLLENGTVKTTVVIQGGGGGGGNSSVITIERLDGSALTVIAGDPAVINYRFTSVDNSGDDTGSATGVWYVGNTKVGTQTIIQGKNSFDVTQYLHSGDNTVKLQVTDSVGSVGTKTWTINVVEFYLESTFDDTLVYSGEVTFRYTPYGNISKTINFTIDGKTLGSTTTAVTGRQLTYAIPAQIHGAHLVEVSMTAEINGKQVTSNKIVKDIMWTTEGDTTPIISCATKTASAKQYSNVAINYTVYDPSSSTTTVTLEVDGAKTATLTVGRTMQTWTWKSADIGTHTLKIVCGSVSKEMPVFGGDTLTIALGKDLVVKSGIYNTEIHEIELTITTGEVIKIPVGSLIDIYIGVATSTATVTVSDDNKISVDVRVSAKANNSITIEEDGLYVAVPDAYTKSETDAKIKKVQDQLDGHSKDAVVHITAEERKAWNAKVSQDELTAAKSEVISAAAADATKKADAARDTAKTYADGLNTAMDNRVKNVEGALTWKAIDDSGANAET